MPKVVVIGCATLLFIAIAPLPYGYYQFLRILVTAVFGWAAIVSFSRDGSPVTWAYVALAMPLEFGI